MKTVDVFEAFGIDNHELTSHVASVVGDVPLTIGGSLADDLATLRSDIDVFCFGNDGDLPEEVIVALYGTPVDIHVVDAAQLESLGPPLRSLLTRADPDVPSLCPMSHAEIVALHALGSGVPLHDEASIEVLRAASSSDVLPLYLALRALTAHAAFAEDGIAMVEAGEEWAALACVRYAAEAAVDALLAAIGYLNPNPKWRMTLALRAHLHGKLEVERTHLLAGLFPSGEYAAVAVQRSLALAQSCMDSLTSHALLRTYAEFDAAVDAHGRLREVMHSGALAPALLPASAE